MLSTFFKKGLGLGVLALCLNFPATVLAVSWEPVVESKSGNLTFYVDKDSLVRQGEIAYAWVESVERNYSGSLVNHLRSFISIDCSTQQFREREMYVFENGQVVAQRKLGNRGPLKAIVPGSMIEGVSDYVCGR